MSKFREQEQQRQKAFWQRQWDRRKEYLGVLLAIAVLVGLHVRHQQEMAKLWQQAQHEVEVNKLLASLRVPSEALYTDDSTLEKIDELRSQAYRRCGAKRVLTFDQVSRAGEESMDLVPNEISDGFQSKKTWAAFGSDDGTPTDDPRMLRNCAIEDSWQNRGGGARLAEELRQNTGLGRYFSEHKEEFNGRIRPLVVRLLGSCHPGFRLDGCAILLAAGERSGEITQILTEYARQPDQERQVQSGQQTVPKSVPSPEKERALRLAHDYGLKLAL